MTDFDFDKSIEELKKERKELTDKIKSLSVEDLLAIKVQIANLDSIISAKEKAQLNGKRDDQSN